MKTGLFISQHIHQLRLVSAKCDKQLIYHTAASGAVAAAVAAEAAVAHSSCAIAAVAEAAVSLPLTAPVVHQLQ